MAVPECVHYSEVPLYIHIPYHFLCLELQCQLCETPYPPLHCSRQCSLLHLWPMSPEPLALWREWERRDVGGGEKGIRREGERGGWEGKRGESKEGGERE